MRPYGAAYRRLRDVNRVVWIAPGFVVLAAAGLAFLGEDGTAGSARARYATATRGTVTATVAAAGQTETAHLRELGFTTPGVVEEVDIDVGDKVEKGQVLARLDDAAAKVEIRAAEAAVDAAEENLERAEQGGGAQGMGSGSPGTGSGSSCPVAGSAGATSLAAASEVESASPSPPASSPTPAPSGSPSGSPTASPTGSPTGSPTASPTGSPTSSPTATASPSRPPSQRPPGGRRPDTGGGCPGSSRAGGMPAEGRGQALSVPQAEAQLTQAEVDLRQARRELDGMKITAPVSGTVLTVEGSVGAQVGGPGASGFVVLGDLKELQVKAEFSEADVVRLRLGQRAAITLAAWPGEQYTGTVTRIDPAAAVDGDLVRYGVMVALDEQPDGPRLGQTASVQVVTDEAENVLRVPSAAVKEQRDGTHAVFLQHGDEAAQRTVRVGVRGDRYVEIISGLSAGDRVVVHS